MSESLQKSGNNEISLIPKKQLDILFDVDEQAIILANKAMQLRECTTAQVAGQLLMVAKMVGITQEKQNQIGWYLDKNLNFYENSTIAKLAIEIKSDLPFFKLAEIQLAFKLAIKKAFLCDTAAYNDLSYKYVISVLNAFKSHQKEVLVKHNRELKHLEEEMKEKEYASPDKQSERNRKLFNRTFEIYQKDGRLSTLADNYWCWSECWQHLIDNNLIPKLSEAESEALKNAEIDKLKARAENDKLGAFNSGKGRYESPFDKILSEENLLNAHLKKIRVKNYFETLKPKEQ